LADLVNATFQRRKTMNRNECTLCNKGTIKSGKDRLLYEDEFCYVVENGNRDGADRRVSLVVKQHISNVPDSVRQKAEEILLGIVGDSYGLEIKRTMGTYPEHYHLHAYVMF